MPRLITGLPSPDTSGSQASRPVAVSLPAPGSNPVQLPAVDPQRLPAPGERTRPFTPRIMEGVIGADRSRSVPRVQASESAHEFEQPKLPSIPPLSPRAKRYLAYAGGALVLMVALGFWVNHLGKTPSEGRVLELLAIELNSDRYRPVALKDSKVTVAGHRLADVRGTLVLRVEADLFTPVAAASLLTDVPPEQLASIEKARVEWESYAGGRVRELAGLAAPPPGLLKAKFIARTHASGTELAGELSATVFKGEPGWILQHLHISGEETDRPGVLRAALPADAIELPTDDLSNERARLIAAQVAYQDAFNLAREKVKEQLLAERSGRVGRLTESFAPGRLAELTIDLGDGPRSGWVEVTRFELAAGSWSGWLRDSESWTETRAFSGTVRMNEDATELALEVSSPQGRRDALHGRLVSYGRVINLRLVQTMSGLPTVVAGAKGTTWRALSAAEAETHKEVLRAGLVAELARLSEAGGIWQGTSTRQGRTESLALRIKPVGDSGEVEAVMWQPDQPDRVRRVPGRMRVVEGAVRSTEFVLGFSRANTASTTKRFSALDLLDNPVTFRLDDVRLTGEGGSFRFIFEPAGVESTAALLVAANRIDAGSAAVSSSIPAKDLPEGDPVIAPSVIDTSRLPALPERNGAYALAGGKWVSLPANNGKARMSLLRIGTGAVSGLGDAMRGVVGGEGGATESARPARVVGKLVFDGNDRPPNLSGEAGLTLVFIGSWATPSAENIAKHPVLAQLPDIEATVTTVDKRGRRETDLREVAPGWANFGDARVGADWAKLTPDSLVWRSRGALLAGRYALVAGGSAFEFVVR